MLCVEQAVVFLDAYAGGGFLDDQSLEAGRDDVFRTNKEEIFRVVKVHLAALNLKSAFK